jgi:hypothetical protein
MDESFWTDLLRPLIEGRRVVVKGEVVAATGATVSAVRALGATDVLIVATGGTGIGPLPDPEDARWVTLDVRAEGDIVAGIRAGNAAIADPPAWLVEEIDRFDPDGTVLLVGDFLNEAPSLAGRPFLAYRRPEWIALDDKTRVDALWDRCGIDRAPSAVVPATVDAVLEVWPRFDRGDGVVLAVDATQGWSGGGSGVRWAPDVDDVATAVAPWSGPDRSVRVMSFLEGVPCSIHGIIFDDDVIALRPVEMVVLRTADHSFFYAGCASFWDPPEPDREAMRSMARTVGHHLRDAVAYRGAFTIDGVMTVDGFRPTELNPRNGGGLNTMARASTLPLQLVLDALVGGVAADWRPRLLEQHLLATFDEHRVGGTWRIVDRELDGVSDVPLVFADDGGLRPAGEEPHDLTLSVGPGTHGSFARAAYEPTRTPVGEATGPLATQVWAYLDRTHELGIGPLEPAHDVRRYRSAPRP